MILVVALLGILFVAGAAFLQSVTFQARTVRADKDERAVTAGLEAIDALSRDLLTKRWLDGDGAPYVPPPDIDDPINPGLDESREVVTKVGERLPYRLQAPAYGVSLGLDPLLASTEPFESTDEGLYTVPTDLNRALLGFEQPQVPQLDIGLPPRIGDWATRIDRARAQWAGAANYPEFDPAPDLRLSDADGDGVADSVVVVIGDPASTTDLQQQVGEILEQWFPATLRESLAEQLRASDVPPGDNRLYLSLRVIDHGGMVNATCTHPYLVNEVINDWNDPPRAAKFNHGEYLYFTPTAYQPEIEERALRYRNILPARSLAASALQTELYGFRSDPNPVTLYAFAPGGGVGGTLDSHRWWPFDPDLETGSGLRYRILFDASPTVGDPYNADDAMAYDRRHLLTTVSYDDLLIRGVRFPRHPGLGNNKSGRDIVEWMRSSDMRGKPDLRRYRDNYPDTLTGGSLGEEYPDDGSDPIVGDAIDPRVGRLQLSIPDLERFLLDKGGPGTTIDNFRTRLKLPDQYHFVGMIYDTFWLMLWNHPDLDGDGTYTPWDSANPKTTDDWERARLAASLTANFIDFADSDDEPTYIQLLDNDGNPVPYYAIGMERQPYITEVYTNVVKALDGDGVETGEAALTSVFALELYNPYTTPLSLDGYILTDESTVSSLETEYGEVGVRLNRISDFHLDGITIPAGGFQVFHGFGTAPTIPGGTTPEPIDGNIAFDHNSILTLRRQVTIPDGSGTSPKYDYAVDRIESESSAESYTRQAESSPGDSGNLGKRGHAVSLQRDTSIDATKTPPVLNWRFVVPRLTRFNADAGPSGNSIHTLGQNNMTLPDTVDASIRPVQVDFANRGSLTAAYPTTGSLLLLMRHANELDLTNGANPQSDPFNHVLYRRRDGNGNRISVKGLIHDYDQIDNGRMPVFDVGLPSGPGELAGSRPYYHKLRTPRDGKAQGVEALPWGQFVFDYFTALPLYRNWERDDDFEQPAVDQGGLRVRGRINIGTASWKVLAGLPLRPLDQFPAPFQSRMEVSYTRDLGWSMSALQSDSIRIGHELAKAIVAYRDAREVPHDCNVGGGTDCSYDYRDRVTENPSTQYLAGVRPGRGFLTVGELANIRRGADSSSGSGPGGIARFDYGSVGSVDASDNPTEDYVTAVGLLVGLGDWVTTRSHVFTIYGTLRGPDSGTDESIAEADAKAIRFEETVNRLPTLFDSRAPFDRIGERFVGKYGGAQAD